MKNKFFFIFFLVIYSSCNSNFYQLLKDISNDYISSSELKYLIDKKETYLLIDLRQKYEYELYHIPTAINIPYNEIYKITNKIIYQKPIIIYSKSFDIQKQILLKLKSLGYEEIKMLNGGINSWSFGFSYGN